jgi:hypothetical protein
MVGRPSLAAGRLAGTEARPTSIFILLREQRLMSDCSEKAES